MIKPVDVSTVRDSLLAMSQVWDLVDALDAGTTAMRAAGTRYLPKWALEEDQDYKARLSTAVLFPAYTETVNAYVARLFSKPLIYHDDIPKWIQEEVLDDVNMENLNFQVFARSWFRKAVNHGMCGVLVESPSFEGVMSVEQQRTQKIRPYYTLISARQLVGWKSNNKGEMTQLRFRQYEEVDDGPYNVKLREVIRVYNQDGDVVTVETHVKAENPQIGKEWVQEGPTKTLRINRIPFVMYYTKRKALNECDPPLRELAYLNQKHWAMQSSTDSLVQTAQVPILAVFGGQSDSNIVIGAKHAVLLPHDAQMKFVEHTGAAINSGRVALDSLKEEMRQAGAKLLPVNNMQAKNTLQAGEEANKESSPLAAMIQDFTDALRMLLYITALWRGEQVGGTVTVQANMDAGVDPDSTMKVLVEMHKNGALSTKTLIMEGQRRGLISNEISSDEEAVAILTEYSKKEEMKSKMEIDKATAMAKAVPPEPKDPKTEGSK